MSSCWKPRMLDPAKDFNTHTWPYDLKFRGHGRPGEYDGLYCGPPHQPPCNEARIRSRLAKIGVPVLAERTAVLSVNYDGRPKCHYCGACGNGCDTRSRFSRLDATIPKLQAKKKFTLRTHVVAHQVLVDKNGKARRVVLRRPHKATL